MSDREDKIEREVLAHKLIAGTATQGKTALQTALGWSDEKVEALLELAVI